METERRARKGDTKSSAPSSVKREAEEEEEEDEDVEVGEVASGAATVTGGVDTEVDDEVVADVGESEGDIREGEAPRDVLDSGLRLASEVERGEA